MLARIYDIFIDISYIHICVYMERDREERENVAGTLCVDAPRANQLAIPDGTQQPKYRLVTAVWLRSITAVQ